MNRAQAIQAHVSIFDVMDVLGLWHHGPGTYQIHCPNPRHDDVNPSARVFGGTNSIYCWTCGKTWDVVELVRDTKQITFNAACDFLENCFGQFNYDKDPAWVTKIQQLRTRGFTSYKEVESYASLIHIQFINWYEERFGRSAPSHVAEFYFYWFVLYDEIRLAGCSNADRIKLYKAWDRFGRCSIEYLSHLTGADIPKCWVEVRAPTYKGAKCSWYYIPPERDVWFGGRQRMHAFRDIWRASFAARELTNRLSTNGRSS